ncbi:hypothetical protein BRADI_1g37815v3 [Brachypodium distachyon]|uniref:Uncharacterized protein n=1 Tax=Brachypodium distachyon TaxID=15368 RepID=A0A2K2DNA9_BRADI|nr:hypothetical protein BRADI_1g37815v3 [Brachypodium distachyon]
MSRAAPNSATARGEKRSQIDGFIERSTYIHPSAAQGLGAGTSCVQISPARLSRPDRTARPSPACKLQRGRWRERIGYCRVG